MAYNSNILYLFAIDTLSWFIDETFTKQIQRVGARCREKITQGCLGELTRRYIIWQLRVSLQ